MPTPQADPRAPLSTPGSVPAAAASSAVPQRIRVFLLEEREIVRSGLRGLLGTVADIAVSGEHAASEGAVEAILEAGTDVAIVDAQVSGGRGLELVRELNAVAPHVRILALSDSEEADDMLEALAAGASGFLTTKVDASALVNAVRVLAAGHSLIDTAVAARLLNRSIAPRQPQPSSTPNLTPQETTILGLITEGMTNRQIATHLFLSEHTVKNHVTRILSKLGVTRRTQAALVGAQYVPSSRAAARV